MNRIKMWTRDWTRLINSGSFTGDLLLTFGALVCAFLLLVLVAWCAHAGRTL